MSSLGKRVFIAAGRVHGKQVQFTLGPFGQLTKDDGMVVANLHATKARHPRVLDAEFVRAARWVDGLAGGAPAILAGDFNVDTARSVVLDHLDGYTKAGPGVDHVVARGASTGPYDRWTPARRALGELALSDHAPVEVEVG